jgi:hypothetical protein
MSLSLKQNDLGLQAQKLLAQRLLVIGQSTPQTPLNIQWLRKCPNAPDQVALSRRCS